MGQGFLSAKPNPMSLSDGTAFQAADRDDTIQMDNEKPSAMTTRSNSWYKESPTMNQHRKDQGSSATQGLGPSRRRDQSSDRTDRDRQSQAQQQRIKQLQQDINQFYKTTEEPLNRRKQRLLHVEEETTENEKTSVEDSTDESVAEIRRLRRNRRGVMNRRRFSRSSHRADVTGKTEKGEAEDQEELIGRRTRLDQSEGETTEKEESSWRLKRMEQASLCPDNQKGSRPAGGNAREEWENRNSTGPNHQSTSDQNFASALPSLSSYPPASTSYSPASPSYSPASPSYSPASPACFGFVDAPKTDIAGGLSLPETLEGLLLEWTTLDENEIHRVKEF